MSGPDVCVAVLTDYDLVYEGLVAMLGPHPRLAVSRALIAGADVVLYDVSRVISNGPDELNRLLCQGVPVLVLIPCAYGEATDSLVPRDVGVLEISMSATDIAEAIRTAATGQRATADPVPVPVHGLSAREMSVLELIAQGRTNQEIGEALFLSINTIKTYIRTAYRKLGITRRSHAVRWMSEQGFLVETSHSSAKAGAGSLGWRHRAPTLE